MEEMTSKLTSGGRNLKKCENVWLNVENPSNLSQNIVGLCPRFDFFSNSKKRNTSMGVFGKMVGTIEDEWSWN